MYFQLRKQNFLGYGHFNVDMVYKLKTDAETRAYVQLLMNFKGVRTENIFNKVNISRSSLYPIVKAQTITDRVRIDT